MVTAGRGQRPAPPVPAPPHHPLRPHDPRDIRRVRERHQQPYQGRRPRRLGRGRGDQRPRPGACARGGPEPGPGAGPRRHPALRGRPGRGGAGALPGLAPRRRAGAGAAGPQARLGGGALWADPGRGDAPGDESAGASAGQRAPGCGAAWPAPDPGGAGGGGVPALRGRDLGRSTPGALADPAWVGAVVLPGGGGGAARRGGGALLGRRQPLPPALRLPASDPDGALYDQRGAGEPLPAARAAAQRGEDAGAGALARGAGPGRRAGRGPGRRALGAQQPAVRSAAALQRVGADQRKRQGAGACAPGARRGRGAALFGGPRGIEPAQAVCGAAHRGRRQRRAGLHRRAAAGPPGDLRLQAAHQPQHRPPGAQRRPLRQRLLPGAADLLLDPLDAHR